MLIQEYFGQLDMVDDEPEVVKLRVLERLVRAVKNSGLLEIVAKAQSSAPRPDSSAGDPESTVKPRVDMCMCL